MAHLHVNPSSGNHLVIDLTICYSTVYMDFTWKVYDDTCGSDHFPILIKSTEPSSKKKNPTPLEVRQGQLGNI